MFFLDNFIITQRTFYMISGFIVLLFGTLINFAISGLFNKNSQKFSNIFTISSLLISSMCFLPFLFGFLSKYSLKSVYFFNKNIAFGGYEILLCFISQIVVLAAFLISKKQLEKLRFKQHYFNCLYLCYALALNMLIISKGFIPFFISLEILSICFTFIILGFKNRNIFYSAYKYLLFSFISSALMIFAYALSSAFNLDTGVLPVIAKILFIMAILIKGGFALTFAWQRQSESQYNYPSFVFLNIVIFYTYAIVLHKVIHEIFETGSVAQIFFALFFICCATFSGFKITRVKNFNNYIYQLNTVNFCILGFLFFINNIQIHTSALVLLISLVIGNIGLLSAGEIFNINKNSDFNYENFKGINYSNALYSKLLTTIIFISATLLPSGIFASKFLLNTTIAQTGLWSSIVMFILAIIYTLTILASVDFTSTFYEKPKNMRGLKIFKKRIGINYLILLFAIITSVLLCFFNGYLSNIFTSFL